ncbi:hypothetical protein HTZ77_36310 [Nonomuraea sp. SMC257]|uniref:WD40 repeat domain-containing protein n=1 Tax=Nonomuraea montanisoli TaxID=2741721 RepID=A0A7Y6IEQ4_9ACTN|nr:hypothetical protein [Nonomuraea montanisoli]NUW36832.1 hypothetical protein [Nonomuraea montanisoli]
MTGVEERLRDALAARAATVRDDGMPPALPVPRATRSGGRWWAPVAVAAAIVVVVAATVVGTRTVAPPVPAARPTPSPGGFAPPVRQVWPGAVHEIPTTAPGGRAFKPDVFVSDRVVVGRGLTRNRPDTIYAYDVDRRHFTRIAPVVAGVDMDNSPVVFGDGYLAWSAIHDGSMEIWAVPVGGGVPRRLASVTAPTSSENKIFGAQNLAISDGMAVWSASDGGVYRVRLNSKGAEWYLVLGSRGFHLVEWPWAGWPRKEWGLDRPVTRPMEHLKNVVTGETRDVRAPSGRTSWNDCGLTWCFNDVEAWRRDGTGLRAFPGRRTTDVLLSGRFVTLHQRDAEGRGAAAVHDIATGRTGLLFTTSTRKGDKAPPTLHLQDGMVWYQTGRGTQVLVDLAHAAR